MQPLISESCRRKLRFAVYCMYCTITQNSNTTVRSHQARNLLHIYPPFPFPSIKNQWLRIGKLKVKTRYLEPPSPPIHITLGPERAGRAEGFKRSVLTTGLDITPEICSASVTYHIRTITLGLDTWVSSVCIRQTPHIIVDVDRL